MSMSGSTLLAALLSCAALLCTHGADGAVRGSVRGVRTSYVRPGTSYQSSYTRASVPAVYRPAVKTAYYPQTVSMTTTAQCDNKWRTALLAEMINTNDWKCSSRIMPDGKNQSCVITGPLGTTTTPTYINTACGWTLPFFCDDSVRDLVTSMVGTQQAAAPPALAGYNLIPGVGSYKVHPEILNWTQAQAACAAEGAHLATPSTATDYSAIWSYLNSVLPSQKGTWLGFTDQAVEGYFRTVNNQPTCMLGLLPFASGEPSGGTTENCLNIGFNLAATLIDIPCSTQSPFICEQTLPTRLTPCRTIVSG